MSNESHHLCDFDIPQGPYKSVALSGYDVCGLKRDGSIACWTPKISQLSINLCKTYFQEAFCQELQAPCPGLTAFPPSGEFTQIVAGPAHFCALRTDQTAACWGAGTMD